MKSLAHRVLIGTALGALGAPALAQSYYLEDIRLGNDVRVYLNQSPHAAPVERVFVNAPQNQGTTSVKVVFNSTPAPSVFAQAEANSLGMPVSGAQVRVAMGYAFELTGPANSYVPINFRGLFDINNDSFQSYTNAQVYLNASTPANQRTESVGMWAQCDGSALGPRCFADTNVGGEIKFSGIYATLGTVQPNGNFGGSSVSGSFQGVLMAPTDASGRSRGSVSLYAFASAVDTKFDGSPAVSSAFIDPELRIDASYLALHPEVTLALTPGVGNEITAVPEPAAPLLMAAGLAALLGLRRRRGLRAPR